jgi:hypothetical protein
MPGADPKTLERAVERIIGKGLGVTIRRETRATDVAILAATNETAAHLDMTDPPTANNGCYFLPLPTDKSLICDDGTLADLAGAVEDALEMPVLADPASIGHVTVKLPIGSPDLAAISSLLKTEIGVMLKPAKRPVEIMIVERAKRTS